MTAATTVAVLVAIFVVACAFAGLYLREAGRNVDLQLALRELHTSPTAPSARAPEPPLMGMLAAAASREGDGRLHVSLGDLEYVSTGVSDISYDGDEGAFVFEWTPAAICLEDLPPSVA